MSSSTRSRSLVQLLIALAAGAALGVAGLVVMRRVGPQPGMGQDPLVEAQGAAGAVSRRGEASWLKGQLHAHSSNSADSQTPPAEVLRWYSERGYDFVVFTDHNHLTRLAGSERTLAIPGVELTQNYARCSPPPEEGQSCLLHVNALFASSSKEDAALRSWPPGLNGESRLRAYGAALEASRALGGVAMLNHPNLHYALDAELIARLAGEGALLLEVANEAVDSNNAGDRRHPSTEALWDGALTRGARIWGTATDDAHHYFDAEQVAARGELAYRGDRGFVMVLAQKDPVSIRAALEQGRFYASSGVLLSRVEVADGVLRLEVSPDTPGEHRFEFYGRGGEFLGDSRGRKGAFALELIGGGYVRAVVRNDRGQKAWTQPVFVP